jgi:predicted AAA+ superfamily ATPase
VIERNLKTQIRDALADTPVILLTGARQTGKSTLATDLADESYRPQYLTFDDSTVLAAAKDNPKSFLEGTATPVIFDEVQRVPELFLPLKGAVDKNRNPGSYLLTGSANVLLIPTVSDSLAGRMEVLNLRTLSQGEIEGRREKFIDRICADKFEPKATAEIEERESIFRRALVGGYPEVVSRETDARRDAWFRSYITTILQRDVRDLANIDGLTDLPRLLSILSARAGGLLNYSEVSRSSGLPQTTLKRYAALLEQIYLIEYLPAYSGSLKQRLVRSPKLLISDTGLLSHLQGLKWEKIKFERSLAGPLIENFVYLELKKQSAWNETPVSFFHFRTSSDQEVDLVLEMPDGTVVGIEIKSGSSIGADAFKGLRVMEAALGKKFKRGIVLYAGDITVPFAENMFAVPISDLWS